jgi:alpha-L-rhamnosidase
MEDSIPLEVFDARLFPFGWEQPGFYDNGWDAANMITTLSMNGPGRSQPPAEPYGPLHPRPIGKLGGDRLTPVSGQVQSFSADVDQTIGDPVRRLEATLNLNTTGPARGSSLPVLLNIPDGGSARIILDMGRIVMGQVQFELDAPAGTTIDLSYTEDPLAPRKGGFGGMHAGTRYTSRGENDTFSVYDAL